MKTIKKQSKQLALLLCSVLLFASCVAYKATPLNLDELVESQEKVRVEYKNSEIYRFKKLESEDGNYYGLMNEKLSQVKKPIDVERIKNVRIYDKSKSTMLTIGVPIVMAGFIYIVAKKSVSVSPSF